MSYVKRIICLANAYKNGGTCVAGIEIESAEIGRENRKWIRPVSARPTTEASRTFGVGMFDGKKETIPADFLAIEDEMKRLRDSALPPGAKPCHFARAIHF